MDSPLKMNAEKHRIHPFEFLQYAMFGECNYPADITEETRDILKDLHPSMFIGDNISFMLFKIEYEYTTKRQRTKTATKYLLLSNYTDLDDFEVEIMAETKFQTWVTTYNIANPFRSISNVKILEIEPLANASLMVG